MAISINLNSEIINPPRVVPDPRIAELHAWAAETGRKLPLPVTLILWFEDKGKIVDLVSGTVSAPIVEMPTPTGHAIAHLLQNPDSQEGGLS